MINDRGVNTTLYKALVSYTVLIFTNTLQDICGCYFKGFDMWLGVSLTGSDTTWIYIVLVGTRTEI